MNATPHHPKAKKTYYNAQSILLLLLGVTLAAIGLKGFLIPNAFIDGGVTGLSLLTSLVGDLPFSALLICINIPFIILGYYTIGKQLAFKSIVTITLLAIAVDFIQFPAITSDKLLIAVFGGIFLGGGIGFSIRGGAVLDGTEVLAIYITRKTSMTIGDIILLFNVILFSVAAYLLSVEQALYSVLIYFSASRTVDFIVEGVDEYLGVTIISPQSEDIRKMIIAKLEKGVTIYSGKRGLGETGANKHMDIVYTVITRLEVSKLENEVEKIDPNSFITMTKIKDIRGGLVKKRITNKR